jgi:hypothetical protein
MVPPVFPQMVDRSCLALDQLAALNAYLWHSQRSHLPQRKQGAYLWECADVLMVKCSGINVGIGTSSPRGKVEIVGPASETSTLANAVTNAGLLIKPYSSSDWGLAFGSLTGQVQSIQGVDLGGSSSRSIAINALGGDVGIGTTSPSAKLDVLGSGTIYSYLRNSTTTALTAVDSSAAYFGSGTSSPVIFQVNNGEKARIDSSGNVGIGTSSPVTALTLGTGTTGVCFQSSSATLNSGKIAVIKPSEAGTGNGHLIFETYEGGSGGGERVRITNAGNLLVGTTTVVVNSKITVNCPSGNQSVALAFLSGVARASGTQYGYSFWRDSAGETNAVTFVENGNAGNNSASYVVRTNAATGGGGITNVSGGVALVQGATSWSSYSDLRLKHDVVPVTNAIESILKIDPIFFKWNDRPADQQRSIGVSAQSVEEVFPELIDRSGIYDVEGGAMQVRYTELIPILLASIQELKAELDTVKAELATLKGAA